MAFFSLSWHSHSILYEYSCHNDLSHSYSYLSESCARQIMARGKLDGVVLECRTIRPLAKMRTTSSRSVTRPTDRRASLKTTCYAETSVNTVQSFAPLCVPEPVSAYTEPWSFASGSIERVESRDIFSLSPYVGRPLVSPFAVIEQGMPPCAVCARSAPVGKSHVGEPRSEAGHGITRP